jgi:hypothetical protein
MRYLLEKFPNTEFSLNLGPQNGNDIISKDGTIVAEVFAAVNPSNNNKLNKDIKRLAENKVEKNAKHKFIFFYTPFEAQYPEIDQEVNIVRIKKLTAIK